MLEDSFQRSDGEKQMQPVSHKEDAEWRKIEEGEPIKRKSAQLNLK